VQPELTLGGSLALFNTLAINLWNVS